MDNTFIETITNYNLYDVGSVGDPYTWINNQLGNDFIQAKLDGVLVYNKWLENYHNYVNYHLLRYACDHNPILFCFSHRNVCRIKEYK